MVGLKLKLDYCDWVCILKIMSLYFVEKYLFCDVDIVYIFYLCLYMLSVIIKMRYIELFCKFYLNVILVFCLIL